MNRLAGVAGIVWVTRGGPRAENDEGKEEKKKGNMVSHNSQEDQPPSIPLREEGTACGPAGKRSFETNLEGLKSPYMATLAERLS